MIIMIIINNKNDNNKCYKVRWIYYKLRQLFFITKCDTVYYKLPQM